MGIQERIDYINVLVKFIELVGEHTETAKPAIDEVLRLIKLA